MPVGPLIVPPIDNIAAAVERCLEWLGASRLEAPLHFGAMELQFLAEGGVLAA